MSDGQRTGAPLPQRQPAPTSPQAAAYAKAQAARQGVPKYTDLRGGGPTPPIPPLDGPAPEGQTMAEFATNQRRPPSPVGSIFQGAQKQVPSGPDIRPSDLLPPEAQHDPGFVNGSGSMYAVSQPSLALKYGVVREGGRRISPQQLMARPVTPGGQPKVQLRPETIEGIQKLQELGNKGESGELAAERDSAQSSAGAAADLGTSRGPMGKNEKTMTDEEKLKKLASMDEFDLNTLHDMMVHDIINNEEQKKIVEERCKPLNLTDLVVNYTVTQVVPIVPGVFEPEFESVSGEDELSLKKMIVEEAKTLNIADRYLLDKYSLMGLTCALKSINGKPLGSHRDQNGDFNEELLKDKFKKILRMPLPMLAALGPHYFWFDLRVRKLFVAEKVKNG